MGGRGLLIIGAILLIHPGIITDLIGMGLGGVALAPQWRRQPSLRTELKEAVLRKDI